jgi:hypothetical protein
LKAAEGKPFLPTISQDARKTAQEKANWPHNFGKLLEAYENACKLAKVY